VRAAVVSSLATGGLAARAAAVGLAAVALTAAGCARNLPRDPSAAALYRDLEREVTIAETTGWSIDRLEVQGILSDALDSVCRVDPLARRMLLTWLDEQIAARGGPVEAAWLAHGKDRGAIDELLILHRVRLVLDAADRVAGVDCPFWLAVEEPFRGRQISDDRWQLTMSGGGKAMLLHQGSRYDLSGGGAGRLLLGRTLGSRAGLYAGLELGATASFPKDELGNRGDLVIGIDIVTPIVYRHTLTNVYLEGELGWLGKTNEEDFEHLDHGLHLGVSIGARSLRTRFFFPGVAFGAAVERTFLDGDDLTTIKLGARVGLDIDLW
jgi:hypothetical protein